MEIRNVIDRVYINKGLLTSEDYEKSRNLFIAESSAAVSVFSLTSGAFLSGFVKYLGGSDEINGIIGAIPALASVLQIFSSLVFEKLQYRKFLVAVLCFLYRLTLGFMFFVPMVFKGQTKRVIALGIMYLIAYALAAFITPPASNWIVDLVPIKMRGRYFAIKDGFSLGVSTIIIMIIGKILDNYRGANNEYGGFLILAAVVIFLTIINFYFLSIIKEPTVDRKPININLNNIVSMTFENSSFKKMIILSVLWNFSFQIGGPYFPVYMVTGLKLSYSYITIIGVVATIFKVFVMKTWGKLADKNSWFFTTKYSIALLGITHFLWIFVDMNLFRVLVPILTIMAGIAWAGIGFSLFNIQFLYAPEEGRTVYLGASAALGGIIGFLSAMIGSLILKLLEGFNFSLANISIGNMQIVLSLSGVLLIGTALYVHYAMEKTYSKESV